jgi:histidinol-phosphatase (PHP family)
MCDGKNTAEEMVLQAISLGFTHLGFSGHMDADIHMDTAQYYSEIHRLQQPYEDRLQILCGIELDNLYDPSCTADAEYVIGSTHFLDVPSDTPLSVDAQPAQMQYLAEQYFSGDYYRLARHYYELEAKVYEHTHCDFIGHFDLVTRFNDQLHFLDETDPRYYKPALETMESLVKLGLPFEINTGAVNRGRKAELYPNLFLLKALKNFGGEILINSDAHQKELLDGGFEIAITRAIACGFTHVNILDRHNDGRIGFRQIPLDTIPFSR